MRIKIFFLIPCSLLVFIPFIRVNANMEMEEQILAEGCREGEDTARRELYDRYAAVCWPSVSVIRATGLPPRTSCTMRS